MREQFGEPFLFLVAVLVAWRLTAMLAYERGPLGIVTWLRRTITNAGLGRLAACFHCLGVWVSLGVALAIYRLEPETVLLWPALAGAISITERWLAGSGMTEVNDE